MTSLNKQTVLSETEFAAAVKKKGLAFKFQKNMSLMLVDQLNQLSKAKRNDKWLK